MEKVIGKRNTDKVAEIAMTALGYSVTETCICWPCMPGKNDVRVLSYSRWGLKLVIHSWHVYLFAASQILFFVIFAFFGFNCYRLGYVLDLPQTDQNATVSLATNASQVQHSKRTKMAPNGPKRPQTAPKRHQTAIKRTRNELKTDPKRNKRQTFL